MTTLLRPRKNFAGGHIKVREHRGGAAYFVVFANGNIEDRGINVYLVEIGKNKPHDFYTCGKILFYFFVDLLDVVVLGNNFDDEFGDCSVAGFDFVNS